MTIDELYQELQTRKIPAGRQETAKMDQMIRFLLEWNQKMNLTAIKDPEEAYEKHLLDCLLPLAYRIPQGTVCDVGSGAGFPGLVWAIVLPDVSFTLLEPREKRCTFLRAAVNELELPNTQVVCGRAEEFAKTERESFDCVTARAVANLSVLSELCLPLVKVGGVFAALKGPKGNEEYDEAAFAVRTLGGAPAEIISDTLPSEGQRTIVYIEKTKPTPPKYPRSYAKIKQKPLMEKH